ncbi:phage portal protein [Clostridium perfringens]|nr:phage portal protein [Clostridium perfringens]
MFNIFNRKKECKMEKIDLYVQNVYRNNPLWFTEEVEKPTNSTRIARVWGLKEYLSGKHKVLGRQDIKYQEKEYKVKKLILNNAKSILNFHATYLTGKPISLTGEEDVVKEIESVYKFGGFNETDFKLTSNVCKYGDGFEYIYRDNGIIKSKIISSEDSYPVFNDAGEYIAFIEHWTNTDSISYWNVYYEDRVEEWTNEGSEIHKIDEYVNESGLPVHYYFSSDEDSRYGESLLNDIVPILDELEDLLSKMGDSIYTLSLNPLLLTTGQAIEGTVNKDGVGYNVALEVGSNMQYVSASMDYSTIKLYLDTLQNNLNMCAYMPSILGGNGNIANVSEVSLKLLYQLADVYAMITEKAMMKGFRDRFRIIKKMLNINESEYIGVTFNYARPQNASELLENIKKQFDMGAISKRSIIEKSPITVDVDMELDRIEKEGTKIEDKVE